MSIYWREYLYLLFILFLKVYLKKRERGGTGGRAKEKNPEVDFPLSENSKAGLDPRSQRS